MTGVDWYRDLFRIDSPRISALLFLRVAVAVGAPLLGFVLAGHRVAAVVAGSTALFVTLCDIGRTRCERVGTMAVATIGMLAGGIIGDWYGGTTWADEAIILASAFVAAWVSSFQPGISAIARFSALATAAGAGMQVQDPVANLAVVAGGASAIGVGYLIREVGDAAAGQSYMDWRAGVRRALAGADVGPWFAFCFAGACALSLLAAKQLGVHNPQWATFTVIMVMRREGMVSLKLVILYMLGTLAGVPLAGLLAELASGHPVADILIATIAAASVRLGLALNAAIGFLALSVFLMLIVELVRDSAVPPLDLVFTRLYDVGVGCAIALVGISIAGLGSRPKPGTSVREDPR